MARSTISQPQPPFDEAAADGESAAGVKSARRAIELLEAFGSNHAWTSLTELHVQTGFPRSSLHGLLRTLRDLGWIEADDAGTRFRLGVRALICGTAYLDRDPVVPYATDALEPVPHQTASPPHYPPPRRPHTLHPHTPHP